MTKEKILNSPPVKCSNEEVASDLLYTCFQSMDEYITEIQADSKSRKGLVAMQQYVEKQLRWYARTLYKVEVD